MTGATPEKQWGHEAHTAHVIYAVTALLLSLLLHGLLIEGFPTIFLRGRADAPQEHPEVDIVIENVDVKAPPPVKRPETFSPDKPDESFAFEAAPDFVPDSIDPVLMTPDSLAKPNLEPAAPVIRPDALPERHPWEALQERIEISGAMIKDEITTRPRRLEARVDRVPNAPDFPTEGPPDMKNWLPAPATVIGPEQRVPAGLAGEVSVNMPGLRLTPAGTPAGFPEVAWTDEVAARLVDDKLQDITPLKSIEHLLALELQSYRPEPADGFTYFRIDIRRAGPDVLPVLPKDILFVQDCSESITQARLDQCKVAMSSAFKLLNPADRFEVMSFHVSQFRCFEDWAAPTPLNRAKANFFVDGLESRGRTDVNGAMNRILSVPRDSRRPAIAFLLTDGRPTIGVSDDSRIIEDFSTRNAGDLSVFSFGEGEKANRFLLDFLGYKNRGGSSVAPGRAEIPDFFKSLVESVNRPVLHHLKYRFTGISDEDIYPRTLTHLYLDRPLVLLGRFRETPQAGFQVIGASESASHDLVFRLDWAQARVGGEDIRRDWAWQKSLNLIGEHIRTGNGSLLTELRRLSHDFNLMIPYISDLESRRR